MKQNIEKKYKDADTVPEVAYELGRHDEKLMAKERESQIRKEVVEGFVELLSLNTITKDPKNIFGTIDKKYISEDLIWKLKEQFLAQTEGDLVNKEGE